MKILLVIAFLINPELAFAKDANDVLTPEYNAILNKGSIVIELKDETRLLVPKDIILKAREKKLGGQFSYLYTKDGEKKYYTLTKNLTPLEQEQKLLPEESALTVYDNQGKLIDNDGELHFLSFFNYQISFISTDYYAEVYRGTSTTAFENKFSYKQYFIHQKLPINFGLATSAHRGFWTDTNGTVTWNALMIGPSLHFVGWRFEKSQIDIHLSALRSISHSAKRDPDIQKFSTNQFAFDMTHSTKLKSGSFLFGGALNYSQTSVKESSDFLGNTGKRDQIFAFGITIGYRYPWKI